MSWVMHIGKYMENSNGNDGEEQPISLRWWWEIYPKSKRLAVTYSQGDLCLHDMLGSLLLWPAPSQQEKHFTVLGFLNCIAASHTWFPFPAGLQPRKEYFSITFPSTRFFCLFRMIVTVLDRLLNYWSPSVFGPHEEIVHGVEIFIAVVSGLT